MFIVSGANNTAPKGIDRGTYEGKALLFEKSSSQYLNNSFSSAGNTAIYTISCWIKRHELGIAQYIMGTDPYATTYGLGSDGNAQVNFVFNSEDRLAFYGFTNSNNAINGVNAQYSRYSNHKFRDTHRWHHVLAKVDLTTSPYIELFLDGEELSYSSSSNVGVSNFRPFNRAENHVINAYHRKGQSVGNFGNISIAGLHFVDGSALDPTEFGEYSSDTDKWVPKEASGLNYGTNGFHLDFNDDRTSTPDTATTIYDQSGNSNNWTGNSLAAGSFTNDTPIDNYATLNPLDFSHGGIAGTGHVALSEGNLKSTATNNDGLHHRTRTTLTASSDKWYWEIDVSSDYANGGETYFGVTNHLYNIQTPTQSASGAYVWNRNGNIFENGASTSTGLTYASGDKLMFALDIDSKKMWLGKNGSWSQGEPSTNTNPTFSNLSGDYFQPVLDMPSGGSGPGSGAATIHNMKIEFGQNGFTYTPPTGFKALSSTSLPEPTNLKPQYNANIVLYTGNGTAIGSGGNAVTGVGFQPDFTWIKSRDNTNNHQVMDANRGSTTALDTASTGGDSTNSELIDSFDSDGFTVGSISNVNANTINFWSLNLFAGNGSPVSNTGGSITSSVLTDGINFSIVTYTGTGANATIGHGLNNKPDMIIIKCRNAGSTHWTIGHKDINWHDGTDKYLALNLTSGTLSGSNPWNNTAPTSSVFSVGTDGAVNTNTNTYVAYCFKFGDVFAGGSFTGNSSTDGPFIPSDELLMVLGKGSSVGSTNWWLQDSVRSPHNPVNKELHPSGSVAEQADLPIDFLRNGFKLRDTDADFNQSGGTYIWFGIKKNGGQLAY